MRVRSPCLRLRYYSFPHVFRITVDVDGVDDSRRSATESPTAEQIESAVQPPKHLEQHTAMGSQSRSDRADKIRSAGAACVCFRCGAAQQRVEISQRASRRSASRRFFILSVLFCDAVPLPRPHHSTVSRSALGAGHVGMPKLRVDKRNRIESQH